MTKAPANEIFQNREYCCNKILQLLVFNLTTRWHLSWVFTYVFGPLSSSLSKVIFQEFSENPSVLASNKSFETENQFINK